MDCQSSCFSTKTVMECLFALLRDPNVATDSTEGRKSLWKSEEFGGGRGCHNEGQELSLCDPDLLPFWAGRMPERARC
jgi:hypothetical protein